MADKAISYFQMTWANWFWATNQTLIRVGSVYEERLRVIISD